MKKNLLFFFTTVYFLLLLHHFSLSSVLPSFHYPLSILSFHICLCSLYFTVYFITLLQQHIGRDGESNIHIIDHEQLTKPTEPLNHIIVSAQFLTHETRYRLQSHSFVCTRSPDLEYTIFQPFFISSINYLND